MDKIKIINLTFMNFVPRENVALAEFTTLKIGGKARFFAVGKSEDEVFKALNFAEENDLKVFILGGGSNVLIADEGFDGLVLQIGINGVFCNQKADQVFVTSNAGEEWDAFVGFCVEKNLAGIECLSGIPGFIGGTPVQNVGAYGQEVSETIVSVRCFDRKNKTIIELNNADCGFSYRTSIFNTTEKNRYVVLAVTYALKLNGNPKIVYRDLQNYFGEKPPDLRETREAVLKIRGFKSMVIDPTDANSRSVGSFFKNPIVSSEQFQQILKNAKKLNVEAIPSFFVDENRSKIPAAWLIEKSGFHKGFQFGNVGISENHTLAIVNLGNGTAREVLALKDKIQEKVESDFGVDLMPEPIFVGIQEKGK